MKVVITIPGPPIAKKRPRFARRGNFVTTYSDQQTEEGKMMWHIKNNFFCYDIIPAGTPISLDCTFWMPIPASMPKKYRLADGCTLPHVKKPDLDNLVKMVKDCCNGIVWHDDSQVVGLFAQKEYGREPRTVIEVRWND